MQPCRIVAAQNTAINWTGPSNPFSFCTCYFLTAAACLGRRRLQHLPMACGTTGIQGEVVRRIAQDSLHLPKLCSAEDVVIQRGQRQG